MKWSQTRKKLESLLADSARDHVRFHITRYGPGLSYHHRRAWVTWDKLELVCMSCDIWDNVRDSTVAQIRADKGQSKQGNSAQRQDFTEARAGVEETLRTQGIFCQCEFLAAVDEYLGLSIEAALRSENPIVRAIAMFDRRLGKRRLLKLQEDCTEHSLVRLLRGYRCEAEGVATVVA